jgi:hypothetical protein
MLSNIFSDKRDKNQCDFDLSKRDMSNPFLGS